MQRFLAIFLVAFTLWTLPAAAQSNKVDDALVDQVRLQLTKDPIVNGGALAVDYGFLLNPSEFLIPQFLNTAHPTTAIYRLHQGQIQFRFTQTF